VVSGIEEGGFAMTKQFSNVMRDAGKALIGLADLIDGLEVPEVRPSRPAAAAGRQGATVAGSGFTGRDLKLLLKNSGMSREELARAIGVTDNTVRLWIAKRGRTIPPGKVELLKTAFKPNSEKSLATDSQ
jgi:DNA-binding transcriptional regulator YiaG